MTRSRLILAAWFASLAGSLFALIGSAFADQVYEAASLTDALKTLPCEAFRKDIDGAWMLVAKIRVGTSLYYGEVWKETRESRILDGRCSQ